MLLSEHSVEVFIKSVKLYNHIGKLCWQKNAIFEHFNGTPIDWAHLHVDVTETIVWHLRILHENEPADSEKLEKLEQKWNEGLLPKPKEIIYYTLKLANNDPSSRNNLFGRLESILSTKERNPSHYIAKSLKKYETILPLDIKQDVIPFLQFCMKSVERTLVTDVTDISLVVSEAKKRKNREQIMTLKNSLVIMEHFRSNLNKKEAIESEFKMNRVNHY